MKDYILSIEKSFIDGIINKYNLPLSNLTTSDINNLKFNKINLLLQKKFFGFEYKIENLYLIDGTNISDEELIDTLELLVNDARNDVLKKYPKLEIHNNLKIMISLTIINNDYFSRKFAGSVFEKYSKKHIYLCINEFDLKNGQFNFINKSQSVEQSAINDRARFLINELQKEGTFNSDLEREFDRIYGIVYLVNKKEISQFITSRDFR